MFDISFVQFESTIASVLEPTTWRATCNEECCCIDQRQKKARDNQLGDVINEPTPILDGSAPSRCTTGRTCRASNCEHIMCEENCVIIVTVPDEPDDATTSPSFDLDVFPDDSVILRCVVNMEFAKVTVASIIVTRNCCVAPKFQRVLKRYNITISWWITASD